MFLSSPGMPRCHNALRASLCGQKRPTTQASKTAIHQSFENCQDVALARPSQHSWAADPSTVTHMHPPQSFLDLRACQLQTLHWRTEAHKAPPHPEVEASFAQIERTPLRQGGRKLGSLVLRENGQVDPPASWGKQIRSCHKGGLPPKLHRCCQDPYDFQSSAANTQCCEESDPPTQAHLEEYGLKSLSTIPTDVTCRAPNPSPALAALVAPLPRN